MVVEEEEVEVVETLAEVEDMEVQISILCSHFCFIVCSGLSQRFSKSIPY